MAPSQSARVCLCFITKPPNKKSHCIRNVPISEIAKAIHKDAQYIRVGLQQGLLKFGCAIKMGDSGEYNYYCSDKKVWEETGYFNPDAAA